MKYVNRLANFAIQHPVLYPLTVLLILLTLVSALVTNAIVKTLLIVWFVVGTFSSIIQCMTAKRNGLSFTDEGYQMFSQIKK